MSRSAIVWWLLACSFFPGAQAKPKVSLEAALDEVRKPKHLVNYQQPSPSQRAALRKAASSLLTALPKCQPAALQAVRKSLVVLEMELLEVSDDASSLLVLREHTAALRGAGAAVFRCGKSKPLVIQAPHSYHDLNTFQVGRRLFEGAEAQVFMTNTLHRYKSHPAESPADPFHPADVAHNEASYFQAITEGLYEGNPGLLFVQFHGFDGKHTDIAMLASDGYRDIDPQPLATQLATSYSVPFKFAVFGKGMPNLGGTTNVQGRYLRVRKGRFLHLETDLEVRRLLVHEKKYTAELAAALANLSTKPASAP